MPRCRWWLIGWIGSRCRESPTPIYRSVTLVLLYHIFISDFKPKKNRNRNKTTSTKQNIFWKQRKAIWRKSWWGFFLFFFPLLAVDLYLLPVPSIHHLTWSDVLELLVDFFLLIFSSCTIIFFFYVKRCRLGPVSQVNPDDQLGQILSNLGTSFNFWPSAFDVCYRRSWPYHWLIYTEVYLRNDKKEASSSWNNYRD